MKKKTLSLAIGNMLFSFNLNLKASVEALSRNLFRLFSRLFTIINFAEKYSNIFLGYININLFSSPTYVSLLEIE